MTLTIKWLFISAIFIISTIHPVWAKIGCFHFESPQIYSPGLTEKIITIKLHEFQEGDRLLITTFAGSMISGKIHDHQDIIKFSFAPARHLRKFIYTFPKTAEYGIRLKIAAQGEGTGAAIRCLQRIH